MLSLRFSRDSKEGHPSDDSMEMAMKLGNAHSARRISKLSRQSVPPQSPTASDCSPDLNFNILAAGHLAMHSVSEDLSQITPTGQTAGRPLEHCPSTAAEGGDVEPYHPVIRENVSMTLASAAGCGRMASLQSIIEDVGDDDAKEAVSAVKCF